jgi:hypothetical protein
MKKIAIPAILAAASNVLAWDEYGALGAKKLEIDAMINYTSYNGSYDEDGKKQDLEDASPAMTQPVLQVKYGIIDGLDVEVAIPFTMNNDDLSATGKSVSGLDRPNLGVKYTHASGFGGFLAADLPVGSEDIVGKEPATSIYAALQYTKTFGKVALNDFVLFKTTLEVEESKPADLLWIYVKPQYNVTDKIGPYLGLDYQMNIGKKKEAGEEEDAEANLLTLKPGINFIATDAIGLEANVPVTVLGKNNGSSFGVYAGFYYTIGL